MKKKINLITAILCLIATANIASAEDIIFYDIDFSSPEHTVGLPPATGGQYTVQR